MRKKSAPSACILRIIGVGHQRSYTAANVLGFLISSSIGISLLVFLNAAQAFVLVEIHGTTGSETTKIAGTLVFADELLCLVAVLAWGRLADATSPRLVVIFANLIAGIAISLFAFARNVFPQLLLCRLLLAIGASGITAMLPALLSTLAAAPNDVHQQAHEPLTPANEDQPLLGWRRAAGETVPRPPQARLAACLGISTGLGALLAVFGYLRLPITLQKYTQTATQGLQAAFLVVAAIAVCNAVLAFLTLPRRASTQPHPDDSTVISMVRKQSIFTGFVVAHRNKDIALGYAGAFVARAQTIATSAFVPVYVASYYYQSGLCVRDPSGTVKETCHAAYAFASALTGVIQLVSLLSAPSFGFTTRPARTMSMSLLLGGLGFILLGRSAFGSSIADPRHWSTWPAAVLIGQSTMAAITLSLALLASGRQTLLETRQQLHSEGGASPQAESATHDNATSRLATSTRATSTLNFGSLDTMDSARVAEVTSPAPSDQAIYHGVTDQASHPAELHRTASVASDDVARGQNSTHDYFADSKPDTMRAEIAGTIAGAYSFCGGLGILAISGLGSLFSAGNPAVLFVLMAALNVIVSLSAAVLPNRHQ